MTTELEEQFFKVFGIEPKYNKKSCKHCKYYTESNFYDGCIRDINFINCPNTKKFYPKITDRKLLEMICILGTAIRHFKIPPKLELEQLKYHILRNCINEQEGIYTRIRQLFKEEE